jgi:hypothetical protein
MPGRLALLTVAALAACALPATALPLHVEADNPVCDWVPGSPHPIVCSGAYAESDPEAFAECLVLAQPTTTCGTVSCTLDMPPSRCGNTLLAFGLHF